MRKAALRAFLTPHNRFGIILALNKGEVQEKGREIMKASISRSGALAFAAAMAAVAAVQGAIDPYVPVCSQSLGEDELCAEIERINAATGFRRFCICRPTFNGVMFGPVEPDLFAKIGRDVGALRERLSP